ncbi:MAG: class I SAM-dependent methyltransferase [Candidatus Thorarchaeota archaeon]
MTLFDRVAHRYNKFVGPFNLHEINDYLPLKSDALLIDFGGGTGRVAFQLSQHVSECIVFDLSYAMLQQAKNNSNKLSLIQGSGENTPFRTNSINQIFLNDSLHHIQKQRETLEECYRILSPGGELIIREFDKKYFWNIFLIIGEAFLRFKSKFYSPKQLSEVCQEIGFKTNWVKPSKATFILIAKKKANAFSLNF